MAEDPFADKLNNLCMPNSLSQSLKRGLHVTVDLKQTVAEIPSHCCGTGTAWVHLTPGSRPALGASEL